MDPLKPRDIRNYLLEQSLPIGYIAKIVIVRILEVIQAIPVTTLLDILEKRSAMQDNSFYEGYIEDVDFFLENHCKIPTYLIEGIHLMENGDTDIYSFEQMKSLVHKINSPEFTDYFSKLDDDFLGKLNEDKMDMKGVVYTPKSIISHIVTQIFNPIFSKLDEEIQKTTVFDPACGSGPFLVKSFEHMAHCYATKHKSIVHTIPELILSCLYGIDIDRNAIYFTRLNLWLASIKFYVKNGIKFSFEKASGLLFSILENNIILGDSLVYVPVDPELWKDESIDLEEKIKRIVRTRRKSEILENFIDRYFPKLIDDNFAGFDIIIGNPPYISSKELPFEYKELLRELYTTAIHQFDLYSIFIELSLSLLAPRGYFAFIIPESYLGRSSFTENRRLLLKSTHILKIENIQRAFPKKSVSNIIIFFQKGWKSGENFDFIYYPDKNQFTSQSGSAVSIPQQYCYELENSKILCHSEGIRTIIQKIQNQTVPLGSSIKIHRGEEIGKKSELIIRKSSKSTKKIISGENIKNFFIEDKQTFIRTSDVKKGNAFYFQPKILVRQLGSRIQSAYDRKGEYVTLQTVYNIISSNESISNEFLLGLLNSDLVQFYYEVIFREKQIFPRILLENILQIPLIVPDQKSHLELKKAIKTIIESLPLEKSGGKPISQLNDLIYDLYKIDKNEKKIIENYLNS